MSTLLSTSLDLDSSSPVQTANDTLERPPLTLQSNRPKRQYLTFSDEESQLGESPPLLQMASLSSDIEDDDYITSSSKKRRLNRKSIRGVLPMSFMRQVDKHGDRDQNQTNFSRIRSQSSPEVAPAERMLSSPEPNKYLQTATNLFDSDDDTPLSRSHPSKPTRHSKSHRNSYSASSKPNADSTSYPQRKQKAIPSLGFLDKYILGLAIWPKANDSETSGLSSRLFLGLRLVQVGLKRQAKNLEHM